jgi:hypothetical protein
MVQSPDVKKGKSREVPKLIKKALVAADLSKKLNESTLIASPMSHDTALQVEQICQPHNTGPKTILLPLNINPTPPIYHPLPNPVKLGHPLEVGDLFPLSEDKFDEEEDEDLLDYELSPSIPMEASRHPKKSTPT